MQNIGRVNVLFLSWRTELTASVIQLQPGLLTLAEKGALANIRLRRTTLGKISIMHSARSAASTHSRLTARIFLISNHANVSTAQGTEAEHA